MNRPSEKLREYAEESRRLIAKQEGGAYMFTLDEYPAWLEEAAVELEKAHRVLDDEQVPRAVPNGVEYTLAARVALLAGDTPE